MTVFETDFFFSWAKVIKNPKNIIYPKKKSLTIKHTAECQGTQALPETRCTPSKKRNTYPICEFHMSI